MTVTLQQLQQWLTSREDEHLEFKEAKQNFHFDKLVKYCPALANEGGGSIVLGVTDKRPLVSGKGGGMTADCLAKTQFRDPNGHPAHPACLSPTAIKPAVLGCYRRSESHIGRRPKTQFRPNSDPIPTQSGPVIGWGDGVEEVRP